MSNRTSFWTFSLAFYARPGVADVCLDLQDRHSVDVNVLLFLLWQAARGRRLAEGEIRRVTALVADWRQHVVLPLHSVRRFLKAPAVDWPAEQLHALRERVKADELQAERLQQETMERTFAGLGTPDDVAAAAQSSCAAYAEVLAVQFPQQHVADLVSHLTGDV
ncbi:TIGR02444 family protein [Bradyrhizobium sp. NP1]|uniref:TIGR02444 family protein n=1 Tax=Bradyrhizobium sp. NP1 TaxID=3049772 RepID=UPI0025A52593|nr:TIGR02444 family protein [Bradyrhizobium sp. NP1]WJR77851.1 TIGR02444 family protein [Bradyrhizobium sp. NP1]